MKREWYNRSNLHWFPLLFFLFSSTPLWAMGDAPPEEEHQIDLTPVSPEGMEFGPAGQSNAGEMMRDESVPIQFATGVCYKEAVRGTLPPAEGLECRRHICNGYFWGGHGRHALDFCTTSETETFGEGEEALTFEVRYVRLPYQEEESEEEWERILVPSRETRQRYPSCGTYSLSDDEFERIIWGDLSAAKFQRKSFKNFPVRNALAIAPGERRPFTQAEKTQIATVLDIWVDNFREEIEGGEYGSPYSETRSVAEYTHYSMEWMLHGLDPENFSNPGGPLTNASIPEIRWQPISGNSFRPYQAQYRGDDIPVNPDFWLEGGDRSFDAYFVGIIAHELAHAANDAMGIFHFRDPDSGHFTDREGPIIDEWLAQRIDMVYLNEAFGFTREFELFIHDPYYSLVNAILNNPEVFVSYLPRDAILSLTDRSDRPANLEERRLSMREIRERLLSDTSLLEPYLHQAVADFEAKGGIFALTVPIFEYPGATEMMEGTAGGILSNEEVIALQHENWLQGATGEGNYSPSGAPGRNGLGGQPPPPGFDPSGNRYANAGQTGRQENDPNWQEPVGSGSWIDVPPTVRQWQPGSQNGGCGSGTAGFNWCWDWASWENRANAGKCQEMMELDLGNISSAGLNDSNCRCSNRSGCRELAQNRLNEIREEMEDHPGSTRSSSGASTHDCVRTGCGPGEVCHAQGGCIREEVLTGEGTDSGDSGSGGGGSGTSGGSGGDAGRSGGSESSGEASCCATDPLCSETCEYEPSDPGWSYRGEEDDEREDDTGSGGSGGGSSGTGGGSERGNVQCSSTLCFGGGSEDDSCTCQRTYCIGNCSSGDCFTVTWSCL